jgi:hypothetical protein
MLREEEVRECTSLIKKEVRRKERRGECPSLIKEKEGGRRGGRAKGLGHPEQGKKEEEG